MNPLKQIILAAGLSVAFLACPAFPGQDSIPRLDHGLVNGPKKVIIFLWDGLRPDSINPTDTPNLAKLRSEGVNFTDNHSTYPTFTMMNSASFATGSFPATTGFYGNTFWQLGPSGNNSAGQPVDFQQPVFTEDYAILQDLDAYYQNQLLLVGTLFQTAQAAGLKTAAIGKSGAAFLQDYKKGGLILDEKTVFPLSLVQELQAAGYALPKTTPFAYAPGTVTLSGVNGDPTASGPTKRLADGATSDPTDASGAPPAAANQYMMNVYLNYILPNKNPDLTFIWFRNPDSTEHVYGVGVANYLDALHAQDKLLGQLRDKLKQLGLDTDTDIVIATDHGHSNVAGPASLFPLRSITNGAVGVSDPKGYSVSGDVRTADLLTRAGFLAFDGSGCTYDPVLSGIKADGTTVYQTKTDPDGSVCGKAGQKYTTGSFKVPPTLPTMDHPLVVAANGGSDYIYVPDRDAETVRKVVRFLQSREEYGAVFVDSKRYGHIAGTLPLERVRLENAAGRNPDIIVSFNFDEDAVVQGFKGTEFESAFNLRGMHGSFSPIDVHNTLLAVGPHFKSGFTDHLPSGNVDVAPTVAHILKLRLHEADGRVLREALYRQHGRRDDGNDDDGDRDNAKVYAQVIRPHEPATGLTFQLPTDPDGKDVDLGKTRYEIELHVKQLRQQGREYIYFDYAKAVRQ